MPGRAMPVCPYLMDQGPYPADGTLRRDICGKNVELDEEEELVKKTSSLFHKMFKISKLPLLEVHIILVMDIFRNLFSFICWKDGQIFFKLNRNFSIYLYYSPKEFLKSKKFQDP